MLNKNEIFHRSEKNPILTAADWPYSCNTVFNPGAIKFEDHTLLLARVEDHRGFSHLTVARSRNGVDGWEIDTSPTLMPDPANYPEEIWGIEDPRITYIEELNQWAVAYTAYSEGGPLVSIATTRDFHTFERIGAVMPPEDKDAALFPVKFNGRWAMIHRPVSSFGGDGAHISISFSYDLKHWGDHKIVIHARKGGWWDAKKIGISPPPLHTPEGWLILYHGVRTTVAGGIYRLGLALLDLEDPSKILHRSDNWIFGPKEWYERQGDVSDVVFPCGWIEENGEIRMYYGCADTSIALATAKLSDILEYLTQCPAGE
ncbi:MAG: glycosidase [ANME-2 cluster archaeon]|jgi:predicted GH43/DUF377 family glycosyl hydrolase|nr:glycosidase [ANME-2 cluster archaeon]